MSELLAPNGKPSNLTAEQYKLVRSSAFKKWFGDWEKDPANASKIVDENGEPKVMYSGSPNKFTIFKTDLIEVDRDDREYKSRFWFIANKENAEDYSRKATGNISSVYEVFLNIRNPKHDFNLYVEDNNDGSVEFIGLKKIWVAIATSSNQIKIADGTNTTFDSDNPDIRFELGGELYNGYKLPKYLYHLTSEKIFENIKKESGLNPEYSKQSKGEKGIYLTDDKSVAENYAGFFDAGEKLVLLKISTDDMDISKFTSDDYELQDFLDDGGWGNDDERIEEYSSWDEVPFELSLEWVNQVQYHKFIPIENIEIIKKLADGTNNTFDSNNPDIRFEDGGELNKGLFSQIWGWFGIKF